MNPKVLFLSLLILLGVSLSGQTLLKDIYDLAPDAGSSPEKWTAVNDSVFVFQAINILQGQTFYASDGTEAGTIGLGHYQIDTDIIRLGNKAFFGGCNPLLGADSCTSLYVSDGTVAGTEFFFDLVPGGLSLGVDDIVAGDSLFYFSGHTINEGYELWRSNGTAAGTWMIADIATGMASGYAGELAVINDVAYFAGYTDQEGKEPWRSDGTAAGTWMIDDVNAGTANGNPSGFTLSGGYIYFSALGTQTGFEVRRTNGQQGNIQLIGEQGTTDSSWPNNFVDSDGTLFYVAEGGSAGFELFVYNHTGSPIHLDFNDRDIFPRSLMPFGNGEVIFNAKNEHGRELWKSDGTLAGTNMIIDLYPGEKDGVYGTGLPGESFYVWNDSLVYFAGADSLHADGEFVYELFVTDGTEAGTRLIKDQYPGAEGTNPGHFFEFGDRLYFAATDPVVGREPFYLGPGNTTSVSPEKLSVTQRPYPNPLPRGMVLNTQVSLPVGSEVHAQLFDLKGQSVRGKINLGHYTAGTHRLQIEPGDHRPGLYCLVIEAGINGQTSTMIILE